MWNRFIAGEFHMSGTVNSEKGGLSEIMVLFRIETTISGKYISHELAARYLQLDPDEP